MAYSNSAKKPTGLTRPIYEKQSDRDRQTIIGKKVAAYTKLELVEHKLHDRTDYTLCENGKAKAVLEIKTRTNDHNKYATYHVSYDKWLHMRNEWKRTGIPHILVVSFTDGVYTIQVMNQAYTTRMGGRNDRNDTYDQEIMIHIPIQDLKKMQGWLVVNYPRPKEVWVFSPRR